MHKYSLTMVIVIFLISTALITSAHPATLGSMSLSTQGNIDYNGHMGLPLLYSTDFETVTKQSSTSLNMGIDNSFVMEGGNMWVEGRDLTTPGITAHSGTKSIGMSGGKRNEFNLMDVQSHFGSTYYMSVWLYFPPGWTTDDWYSIGDPLQSAVVYPSGSGLYLPIAETHIWNDADHDLVQSWGTPGSSTDPWTVLSTLSGWPPIGQWFKYEFYVVLHPTDGILKVWVDGRLLCDVSGLRTTGYVGQSMLTSIAKIYSSGALSYKLWVDDLEIYGR